MLPGFVLFCAINPDRIETNTGIRQVSRQRSIERRPPDQVLAALLRVLRIPINPTRRRGTHRVRRIQQSTGQKVRAKPRGNALTGIECPWRAQYDHR